MNVFHLNFFKTLLTHNTFIIAFSFNISWELTTYTSKVIDKGIHISTEYGSPTIVLLRNKFRCFHIIYINQFRHRRSKYMVGIADLANIEFAGQTKILWCVKRST